MLSAELDRIDTLIEIAQRIKNGELDPILGAARISTLRLNFPFSEDEAFFPFRAIDSDADEFSIGPDLSKYSSSFIERSKKERQDYLSSIKNDLPAYCDELTSRMIAIKQDLL